MPLELPTKLDNKEQVITVDLKGTLNDYTFDQFFKKMTELSNNKDFKTIKLNFAHLKYINSKGMSLLVHLNDIMEENKKSLILEEVPDKMYGIFQLLGINEIFQVCRTKHHSNQESKVESLTIGPLNNKIIAEIFIKDIESVEHDTLEKVLKKLAKNTKFILAGYEKITKKLLAFLIKVYLHKLKEKGGKIILTAKKDKEKQEIRELLGDKYLSCFYVVDDKEKALELLLMKEASKETNNMEERIKQLEKEVHRIGKHFS